MADDLNRGHPVSVTTPDLHTLKRKRFSSDEIIPMDEAPVPGPSRERARRDPTYYYEDGSCILLIEDTLFNVHRSLLSRDNSSFCTLFTLPQGSHEAEGQSDENPIVLLGDKPSEFRHFLWALYALPPELQVVNSSSADLTQLIDIARISNKYSFKSLETWALDAVQEYVNRRPPHHPPSSTFFTGGDTNHTMNASPTQTHLALIENTEQLTRLIQLAQLCNHDRLLNSMIALLRQLMSRSLHYAYLSMALADDLNLRSLRGAAYLEVMQRGSFTGLGKKQMNEENEAEESLEITPAQQLRLLSGYWHLTRTWERFRSTPPTFAHAPSCSATWHQPGCTQAWVEFWKEKTRGEAVMSLGLADVIGRLKQVQKDYDRSGPTYMAHDCKLAARRSLLECIKTVEERLPDYFSDEGLEDDF
ncbi:hypothetical protein BT96DRAFT_913566 [Gymnopus androsaceus JB14]|uniref:BTB domain-containing protein n=1 Tax=Gymnopus androsaceus JB14 TaxID=1447944 RepID=A0A6A4I9R7_9AGAR|nr:hypothetical protein BT96DRAFT_913566 [Gymnopus androsaceus JB14]